MQMDETELSAELGLIKNPAARCYISYEYLGILYGVLYFGIPR